MQLLYRSINIKVLHYNEIINHKYAKRALSTLLPQIKMADKPIDMSDLQ